MGRVAGDLSFQPLTPDRWDALEDLFGPERGASSGCWCMWWRLTSAEFSAGHRDARKAAFRALARDGVPLGILAFDGAIAVGWCAVGPRETLPRLERSRVAKPVAAPTSADDRVWMINCFYIRAGHRKRRLMPRLIEAAVDYAQSQGPRAVEACPIEPERRLQWSEGFHGIASAFAGLGFEEIARRAPTRPLLRRTLGG